MRPIKTRADLRNATQRHRRPPGSPVKRTVRFGGNGELGDEKLTAPFELILEVTGAEGELADWFGDEWWMALIERWGDDPITVQIAATHAALLHPVVLHELEMVFRVAPRWRMVGNVYPGDLLTSEDVELVARSPYHEVRFVDPAPPAGSQVDRTRHALPVEELFGRIRREQSRIGAARPILVRLPAGAAGVPTGQPPSLSPPTQVDTAPA